MAVYIHRLQPRQPWDNVIEFNLSIIISVVPLSFHSFLIVVLIIKAHLIITNFNKCESDLGTELLHTLFLSGPVRGAWSSPDAPVGYLSLQLPVGLLEPVHLLQEALQAGVQTQHGLTGFLQQVHGDWESANPNVYRHTRWAADIFKQSNETTQSVVPMMVKTFR